MDAVRQTSALVKGFGILIGECVFGIYGPLLFMHPLRWFEINYPGAVVIGVLFGAFAGYGVAACALNVHRHATTASRQPRAVVAQGYVRLKLRA